MNKKVWIDYTKVREILDFAIVLKHYDIEHPLGKTQIKIACPFHDDKTPSCSINIEKRNFQCFGCSAKGNALEFVTMMEQHDPKDTDELYAGAVAAIEIMGYSLNDFKKGSKGPKPAQKASNKATAAQGTKSRGKQRTEQNKPESDDEKPETNEILDLHLDVDQAHPYLTEVRGLNSETIETFGLGYCSRGIMNKRIVFPIHNKNGELVAYAGRYADEEIPDGVMRYKLPSTFHKSLELYNLHRAKEFGKRHLVVVEGYWSTIRLHLAGIPAVALMGRSVSETQARLIPESGFHFVTLLLDGDEEGQNAIPDALNTLGRHVYVRAIELPDGIKPDAMPDKYFKKLR